MAVLPIMTSGKPPVVLVVDDEPFILLATADMLSACGATVLEAQDADEALRILTERDDISLVFSDVNMPGTIDGLTLLRRVHELSPAIELVLTSGQERFAKDELPDDGTFLPKPYNASQLCNLVHCKLSANENHRPVL